MARTSNSWSWAYPLNHRIRLANASPSRLPPFNHLNDKKILVTIPDNLYGTFTTGQTLSYVFYEQSANRSTQRWWDHGSESSASPQGHLASIVRAVLKPTFVCWQGPRSESLCHTASVWEQLTYFFNSLFNYLACQHLSTETSFCSLSFLIVSVKWGTQSP